MTYRINVAKPHYIESLELAGFFFKDPDFLGRVLLDFSYYVKTKANKDDEVIDKIISVIKFDTLNTDDVKQLLTKILEKL